MRLLLTFCLSLALTLSVCEAQPPWGWCQSWWFSKLAYTVENKLTEGQWFSHTVLLNFWCDKFFNIMKKAADVNPNFKFTHTMYDPPLGAFVTCMNGLCNDDENSYYWGVMKRSNSGSQCLLPVGVSNYEPGDGEHIVFSYITGEMFSSIPTCEGGTDHV